MGTKCLYKKVQLGLFMISLYIVEINSILGYNFITPVITLTQQDMAIIKHNFYVA